MTRQVAIGSARIGGGGLPLIIAGPCVIESADITLATARELKAITGRLGLEFVFKSSYDKANRTSIDSFRGPGMKQGLSVLADVKASIGVPVLSDIHSIEEVGPASAVLDALQIPAFLSRQTDLIVAAAQTGKPVNVKKGQFMAPLDVRNIIRKFESAGGKDLIITERGTSFGYNNLVVDMRALPVIRQMGCPLIMDVTHSLQQPGGLGDASGGQREFASTIANAATAAGVDGLFFEVHPDPDNALCDGPNMIPLDEFEAILITIKKIAEAVQT